MTKEQAKQTAEKALGYSEAENTVVTVSMNREGSTRFANNHITQNICNTNAGINVTAAFGNRIGKASGDDMNDDAVKTLVSRAVEMARSAHPDPEYMPPVKPAEYPEVDAYDEETDKFSPADRAAVIKQCIKKSTDEGFVTAGSISTRVNRLTVANSEGLLAFHESTGAHLQSTSMTGNSSGWAHESSEKIGDIDCSGVIESAVEKARKSMDPLELPPGKYAVILEPAAVAQFTGFLFWQFWAKMADQGTSFMSGKQGRKVFGDNITVRTEPGRQGLPGRPFDWEGLPKEKMTFIRNGVAETLFSNRYWAQKTGIPATNWPSNIIIEGENNTVSDLVKSTGRGILVSRFWYVRFVDPMEMLLTGMTRDGTFLVEDGEIKHGIKNLRFNDSPLLALNRVEMMSKPRRSGDGFDAMVPAMKISDFNFTSATHF